MSFASGLFSFAGGLSTGLREEIDLANKRKADKAISDAEERTKQAELNEDARRFGITTGLEERKITVSESLADIKSKEQKQKEYEFRQTNKLALNKFKFETEKWHDTYSLQLNEYNLEKSDLEEKLKLAKNKDERDETELSLKVLDRNWNQKQDEIQNQFDIDELDFKKYKVDVENDADMQKAFDEASKGKVDFSKGLTFNKGSYEPKEQPAAFLSWANYNLSKEVIDGLTPEGKLALVTEFNIATERMVLNSKQTDGTFIDLAEDKYNNAFAMAKYLPGALNLKETIKKVVLESEENKDADTVIVNAESSGDGKIKITADPINYEEKIAKLNKELDVSLHLSTEEFKSALDSLVTISKKKSTSALYEDDLNPFESRETLISSLEDRDIPLTILKLAPYVNNIQEASYTNIGVATDYDELVQLAFEYGILTEDENHNIQGESQLIDFIFMMQPKQEYATKSGVTIQPSSSSPDAYGLKETVNSKDAKAQNDAAGTAISTANNLKKVINQSDKIGAALNISAKVYGITTQWEQLSSLWGGTRNNFGNNLRTGDGSNSTDTGGISQSMQNKISKDISTAQRTLNSDSKADAKNKAKMTLLKFTLAYQVSMALQGGSGGRTISDQDVDNILQSLAMPNAFFNVDSTKESTTASLNTLTEFLENIELQSRYLSQNTMKGYRTYVATNEIISAINNVGGVGTDLEDFKNQIIERPGNMTLTEEGGFDWGTEYTNNYRKTWSVEFTSNNAPVYVLYEGKKKNPKESYLMDETEWGNFLSTAQGNNNNMFDNSEPNFSMDTEKESYGGFRVKGLFSELVGQADDSQFTG